MSVNKVILMGNLGRDPEFKTVNGQSVASFSIALGERWVDRKTGELKQKVEWMNCVGWGAVADRAQKLLKKGQLVYLEGKFTTRTYDDKEGVKRSITEVVVHTFQLTGGKPEDKENQDAPISSDDLDSYFG